MQFSILWKYWLYTTSFFLLLFCVLFSFIILHCHSQSKQETFTKNKRILTHRFIHLPTCICMSIQTLTNTCRHKHIPQRQLSAYIYIQIYTYTCIMANRLYHYITEKQKANEALKLDNPFFCFKQHKNCLQRLSLDDNCYTLFFPSVPLYCWIKYGKVTIKEYKTLKHWSYHQWWLFSASNLFLFY